MDTEEPTMHFHLIPFTSTAPIHNKCHLKELSFQSHIPVDPVDPVDPSYQCMKFRSEYWAFDL